VIFSLAYELSLIFITVIITFPIGKGPIGRSRRRWEEIVSTQIIDFFRLGIGITGEPL
jgi:hypothetical protein